MATERSRNLDVNSEAADYERQIHIIELITWRPDRNSCLLVRGVDLAFKKHGHVCIKRG